MMSQDERDVFWHWVRPPRGSHVYLICTRPSGRLLVAPVVGSPDAEPAPSAITAVLGECRAGLMLLVTEFL